MNRIKVFEYKKLDRTDLQENIVKNEKKKKKKFIRSKLVELQKREY